MEQATRHDSYLGLLSRAVRRHAILVLVVVLLGVAGAVAYVHVKPVRYTATATLLPRPLLGNPLGQDISASNGTQLTVAMQTEAGLVDTPVVGALATKSLGAVVPRPQDKVTATVPPNTQIISITYRSTSALHAQQGAQAFAKAFLAYRESVSVTAQQQTLAVLERQRAVATAALRTATRAVLPGSDPRSYASQRQLLYSNQLATLVNRISSTEALSTSPGVVVKSPSLPTAADGLPPYLVVVAGALLAFVLGLMLAAMRERRRDLVDSAVEHDVCGLPLLASLPRVPAGSPHLITDRQPGDVVSEAYRRMRAGLIAVSGSLKVFSICCVSPEAASAPVAANLGICLAQAGFRVTVVTTDADEQTSQTLRRAASSAGLADVLLHEADLTDALHHIHGITFLGAGRDTARARELYAGPALRSVVGKLKLESDFVIVASGATSSSNSDSVALACDGVLIVVSQGVTTHAETAEAIDRFEKLQVTTVGAVSLAHHDRDEAPGSSAVAVPAGEEHDRGPSRTDQELLRHPSPDFGTDS